jgi:hypothetical protein
MNAACNPLVCEKLDCILRRAEKEIGDMIRHYPVDLLGHSTVKAPEPGFDMCNRDVKLGGGKSPGKSRVRVTVHDHEIRFLMKEDFFHPHQHIAGLLSMGTGTDIEMIVRSWDQEFLKKNIRHLRVIVLAGMDEDFSMVLPDLAGHGGTLDKLGPGTHDRDDLHPISFL